MTDVDKWKYNILEESRRILNRDEIIKDFNLSIKNGVAVIEYSVVKIMPLEIKVKGGES